MTVRLSSWSSADQGAPLPPNMQGACHGQERAIGCEDDEMGLSAPELHRGQNSIRNGARPV